MQPDSGFRIPQNIVHGQPFSIHVDSEAQPQSSRLQAKEDADVLILHPAVTTLSSVQSTSSLSSGMFCPIGDDTITGKIFSAETDMQVRSK